MLSALDVPDIAEAAAEALVCGFLRDTNYHLLKFETNPNAVHHLMDVCARSPPAVQLHLINLFAFAFRSQTSKEMVHILVDMNLVGLLSNTLKVDGSQLQEVSVYCSHALLLKVTKTKDLKALLIPMVDDMVQRGVLESIVKVLLAYDHPLEHPVTASSIEIFSIVSFEKVTHNILMAHVYVPPNKSKKATPSSANSLFQKLVEHLGALNRGKLIHMKEAQTAVTHIFMVVHNLISLSPELHIVSKAAKILPSALTILCYAEGLARNGCAEFVYLYKDHDGFDEALLAFEEYDDLIKSVVKSIDADHLPHVINSAMDLLCAIMQKLYKAKQSSLNTDGKARNGLRNQFITIIEYDVLWKRVAEYLELVDHAVFAVKLLNIFASFKDLFVLHYLQERVIEHQLMPLLVDVIESKQHGAAIKEAAYLTIGSLIGCAPINPAEHDALVRLGSGFATGKASEQLRSAQRRANLDEGSSIRELKLQCSNPALLSFEINTGYAIDALVQKVWQTELEWRGICVLKAEEILAPAIFSSATVIVPLALAALRIVQIILRDGASEEDSFHKNIRYYSFVAYLHQVDTVYLILALDVFGIMSAFSDISVDNGIEFVCSLLTNADPVIKFKAVETLVYCSLNANTLECISANSLSALSMLLKLQNHISNVQIDSFFIIQSVLLVISRLVADDHSCMLVLKSPVLPAILELLKLDEDETRLLCYETAISEKKPCVQNIDPLFHHQTPTLSPGDGDIKKLCYLSVCRFAKFDSCRPLLVAADLAPLLLRFVASEMDMVYGSSGEMSPMLKNQSMLVELSHEGVQALTALFYLCSKSHSSLRSELLDCDFATDALIYLWASQHRNLSFMAKIILTRLSYSKERMKTSSSSAVATQTSTFLPWSRLIETKQIVLVFDMLNYQGTGMHREEALANVVVFDELADMQLKSSVCEAVNVMVFDTKHSTAFRGIAMSMKSDDGSSVTTDRLLKVIGRMCHADMQRSLEGLRTISGHVATFLNDYYTTAKQQYGSASVTATAVGSPGGGLAQNQLSSAQSVMSSGQSVVSALTQSTMDTMSVAPGAALQMRYGDSRDKRQAIRALVAAVRNSPLLQREDLGMPVAMVVETLAEVVKEGSQKIAGASTRRLSEAESMELLNNASDVLTLCTSLYEMKAIQIAYQSDSNMPIITSDHVIADLRPLYEIFLYLCRKKSSASIFMASNQVIPTLMHALQVFLEELGTILENPNVKGSEKRLPELLCIWQTFTVLLTISKIGEAHLADKLLSSNQLRYLVHIFTSEPHGALAEVYFLCPMSSDLFNNASSSGHRRASSDTSVNSSSPRTTTPYKEMSLFDRILSVISVLSAGKSYVIDALLDGGKVVNNVAEMIGTDLATSHVWSTSSESGYRTPGSGSHHPQALAPLPGSATKKTLKKKTSSGNLSTHSLTSNSNNPQAHHLPHLPLPPLSLSNHNIGVVSDDDDSASVASNMSGYRRNCESLTPSVMTEEYMMDYISKKVLVLANLSRSVGGAHAVFHSPLAMRRISELVRFIIAPGAHRSGGYGTLKYSVMLLENLVVSIVAEDRPSFQLLSSSSGGDVQPTPNYMVEHLTGMLEILFEIATQTFDIGIVDQALHVLWLLTASKTAQRLFATTEVLALLSKVVQRISCVNLQFPLQPDGRTSPPEAMVQSKVCCMNSACVQ